VVSAAGRDFELVQSTGDPNALAIFIAHNPHHADGLITFAMVFAHTGTSTTMRHGPQHAQSVFY
jgi:hypothetical protein